MTGIVTRRVWPPTTWKPIMKLCFTATVLTLILSVPQLPAQDYDIVASAPNFCGKHLEHRCCG